jgi:hypothetical protein
VLVTVVGGSPESDEIDDFMDVFHARADDLSALQTAVGRLKLVRAG